MSLSHFFSRIVTSSPHIMKMVFFISFRVLFTFLHPTPWPGRLNLHRMCTYPWLPVPWPFCVLTGSTCRKGEWGQDNSCFLFCGIAKNGVRVLPFSISILPSFQKMVSPLIPSGTPTTYSCEAKCITPFLVVSPHSALIFVNCLN